MCFGRFLLMNTLDILLKESTGIRVNIRLATDLVYFHHQFSDDFSTVNQSEVDEENTDLPYNKGHNLV